MGIAKRLAYGRLPHWDASIRFIGIIAPCLATPLISTLLCLNSSFAAWLRLAFYDFMVSQSRIVQDNGFLYETTRSS